jgi:hypothetical protein
MIRRAAGQRARHEDPRDAAATYQPLGRALLRGDPGDSAMSTSTVSLPASIAASREDRGRTLCGWCNRVVALDGAPGAVRHVTCDDCRSLAGRWKQDLASQASGS